MSYIMVSSEDFRISETELVIHFHSYKDLLRLFTVIIFFLVDSELMFNHLPPNEKPGNNNTAMTPDEPVTHM